MMPIPVQTLSDETCPDADLIPRKRKNADRNVVSRKTSHTEDKAPQIPAPEAVAKTMPPLEHQIVSTTSAWEDDMSLTEIMKGLQSHSEMAQKWSQACRRRMLFLDQTIQRRDIEADSFREEVGKLKSLEEAEKDELKKSKNLLTDQLTTITAELESLKTAQAELIARAKAESLSEYLASSAFKTKVDQAAEAKVTDYRTSPTLGRLFVTIMTSVRSVGFTEGVDSLKGMISAFNLEQLPAELRSLYDPSAPAQVESLIRDHGIYTSFDDVIATSPTLGDQTIDQLSNT